MDYLKLAAEIIDDGNLNKLNVLLSMNMNEELAQTLRRIFKYLQQQQLFKIHYGIEWNEWINQQDKTNIQGSQIEQFLNTKWSVFLRILFTNGMYDEILRCVEHSENCPPYRRLVQQNLEIHFQMDYDKVYFQILSQLPLDFDKFIELIKILPEEFDKEGLTMVVQKIIQIMNAEQKVRFTKLLNKYVVDKVDNPLILANFLHNNIDNGSIELQILSLQAMLILMTRYHYNLENYYQKLIQLLNNEMSYIPKFLKLVEISIKSSKLPQQLLLEILDTILRMTLKMSCSQQLWGVTQVFNSFKRFRSLQQYYLKGQFPILSSYKDHWYGEIKKIVSYLEDDLEMFDYMDDMRDISDSTLLEALLI